MKKISLIILLLIPSASIAQESRVQYTDSSIITTRYYPSQNRITEQNHLIAKDKTYSKTYYYDTKTIADEGMFFCGYYVGVWNYYKPDGSLDSIVNYDNKKWCLANSNKFSFFGLLQSMINKGDSIIISKYGPDFFYKHVMWDENRSYVRSKGKTYNWNDKFDSKPDEYLLVYNINLGNEHVFCDLIRIELDANGEIMRTEGFESENTIPTFKITYELAIEKAKLNGLIESDTMRAYGDLFWKNKRTDSSENGHFSYYLIQLYKTEKIDGFGVYKYFIDRYFYVWVFNPWTGELLEFKKMKSTLSWEGGHGLETGLYNDD